ncbi:type I-G CRISPR-associated protein Cas8g2 [Rehaibacterium terrae]|jgi:CRISPR-associated protein Csb3|uniref:CRISPR-associated protein Csx14 n=1 Tax=Rehaibacterium terrae TaxID=1341696 RepID=A0A7W7Y1L8_9GAMM|nr:type I-U CRISPR-associated protein Cas8c [Rehaibacterium terrae]MBB5016454.1 CRISPR-associated protein Csx14 [Rehaibacterium terrae]
MAKASIAVDLFNPGQVFACMGFLEVADVLLGGAEGGFDWTNQSEVRFQLHAGKNEGNPFEAVLQFLVEAKIERLVPESYADPPAKKSQDKKKEKKGKKGNQSAADGNEDSTADAPLRQIGTFPAGKADPMILPLRFSVGNRILDVSHWCDASSRNSFKLFAGQQRSDAISRQMLEKIGELWKSRRAELVSKPFDLTVPLSGSSFKFDARKSWMAIDVGYSPDKQKHHVEASPIVEMLAAIGLEHARPDEYETREVCYGVWRGYVPPILARPILGGSSMGIPIRLFRFTLDLAGKNKNVTFATEETQV